MTLFAVVSGDNYKRNKSVFTDGNFICLQGILAQSDEVRKAYALKKCFYRKLKILTKKIGITFLQIGFMVLVILSDLLFPCIWKGIPIEVLKWACFSVRSFNCFRNQTWVMDIWHSQKKRNTFESCSSAN